jgi:uncharacterized protein (DUF2267 family)
MATRSEEYVYKAKEFLNQVAKQLGDENDLARASQVTASTFHMLRNLLSPEESLHLIAQLPLYLKAAYVDGWHLDQDKQRAKKYSNPSREDFNAVLCVLKKYVSTGEISDVITQLPAELKPSESLC